MKIILLDKIQRLGEIGDIVEVNSGYARNFLIPQKKAAFASESNIAEVESKKDELAAMSEDILTKAKARGESIEGSECEILVPVTEEGGYTIDNRRFGDVHLIKRTKEGVEAASEKSGRGKSLVQPY